MDTELTELVRAIRNRCDIYLILKEVVKTEHLMPTLLEDLFIDAQEIMDSYCVEKHD